MTDTRIHWIYCNCDDCERAAQARNNPTAKPIQPVVSIYTPPWVVFGLNTIGSVAIKPGLVTFSSGDTLDFKGCNYVCYPSLNHEVIYFIVGQTGTVVYSIDYNTYKSAKGQKNLTYPIACVTWDQGNKGWIVEPYQ